MYRYSIFKDKNVTLATFGVGLCNFYDSSNCLVFENLLDKAVLPVPTCMADGTLVLPTGMYIQRIIVQIFLREFLHFFLFVFLFD